ncbi:BCCT family transporter [Providencia stuartii]|jgi:choline/glycine/proline betaine transport protein|uniref:BCCT family transporter n=3 Tax=Morganellaceae TaxID=1903414 RepID=A0A8I2DDK9_9GAMM|nr:BCCT family transporter [Proteus mirabilis]ELQ1458624.1 BCCT family transporter [Providencia rettgeri]ELR5302007.1 BCCT family transporter [Providencia stuartii]MBQ0270792.1 BCCT family transporter [Providencia huaxiensis]ELR5098714.1 BCCT family transporter [Providencia rettgeri]
MSLSPQKSQTWGKINPPVFFVSAFIIICVVAIAAIFPQRSEILLKALQAQLFENASWFYILAVALILLTVAYLGLSRFGEIKLGPDHSQPQFSYLWGRLRIRKIKHAKA